MYTRDNSGVNLNGGSRNKWRESHGFEIYFGCRYKKLTERLMELMKHGERKEDS